MLFWHNYTNLIEFWHLLLKILIFENIYPFILSFVSNQLLNVLLHQFNLTYNLSLSFFITFSVLSYFSFAFSTLFFVKSKSFFLANLKVSVLLANLASVNIEIRLFYVNLLNSWVLICSAWSSSLTFLSISLIFVL